MRSRYLLPLLLLTASSLFGQTLRLHVRNASELYAEQRRVVGTWCRQDYEGLRLTDVGWQRFKPLTTIKNNPDLTTVVIISRYQIEQHDVQNVSWDLDATYTVIGRYDHNSGYLPADGTETVTYRMKEVDGDIVITDFDPSHPHVSKKAAIDWMKTQLASTTSDLEKYHLTAALKQLEPSAPAAAATPTK